MGYEWIDYNLPTPNYLLHTQSGAFIGWVIRGYPGTEKSKQYFNDIVARFIITFSKHKPERLPYAPNLERKAHKLLNTAYDLKEFQGLKSISLPKKHWKNYTEQTKLIDQTFWAIKLHTEDLIRKFSEGNIIPYELIEDFAFRNFLDNKESSTLKAKCRSIFLDKKYLPKFLVK